MVNFKGIKLALKNLARFSSPTASRAVLRINTYTRVIRIDRLIKNYQILPNQEIAQAKFGSYSCHLWKKEKFIITNLVFTVAIVSTARACVCAAQLSHYTQTLQYNNQGYALKISKVYVYKICQLYAKRIVEKRVEGKNNFKGRW